MLEIDRSPILSGQIVGDRFRLETVIGEGGMGTVWSATDTRTNEPRALKFIRRDRLADARSEARLIREARALSTIAHENVARIFEVSELEDGTPFLVMERLVGATLKQRLATLERLTVADTIGVARGIAAGIAAAHAAGIVHRDLKPDNVFILDETHVKVLDFGIAKNLRDDGADGALSLTTTGAMLGTLHYMAPEQVFGDDDIDERADVWALGIVMYECLSGKKPTDASGSGQVLKAIMTGQFARLDEGASGCPRQLADLVNEMLSRDRPARPSMSEVHERLAKCQSIEEHEDSLASSTSEARSPPRPSMDQLAARRWRTKIAGATALLGVIVAMVGVGWRSRADERAATPPTASAVGATNTRADDDIPTPTLSAAATSSSSDVATLSAIATTAPPASASALADRVQHAPTTHRVGALPRLKAGLASADPPPAEAAPAAAGAGRAQNMPPALSTSRQ